MNCRTEREYILISLSSNTEHISPNTVRQVVLIKYYDISHITVDMLDIVAVI